MCAFDALRQRDARRADVGGEGEHLLHGEEAALRLVVMDREFAVMQRPARIPQRIEIVFAGIERHREREGLEGRAHLVDAGGQAIDAIGIVRFLRIVRIEIRQRDHRDDLAGPDVGDEAGGRLGVELLLGLQQFVAQRVLDPQIDRQLDRTLQAIGGEAGAMQIGETVGVEPLLHPGDALVVDVDEADQVRDLVAGRIDALVLAQEADAGNAEAVDFLLLLRRDFALQPDEAFLRRQPLAHFAGVEIGQGRGQKLDRLVLVDDAARLAEQARRLDVGGEDFAVAVDDIGPRGRDRVLRCAAARAVAVGAGRKHHEPAADHGIDRGKGQHHEADAGARLRGAIDVAAVQQAADQPLPPGFGGLAGWRASRGPSSPVLLCRDRAGHRGRIGGCLDGLDHRADRIGLARLDEARRPIRQVLQVSRIDWR